VRSGGETPVDVTVRTWHIVTNPTATGPASFDPESASFAMPARGWDVDHQRGRFRGDGCLIEPTQRAEQRREVLASLVPGESPAGAGIGSHGVTPAGLAVLVAQNRH
jgi:hypothetical protein